MHRVTGATLGAVGVGLVVAFLVAGFVVGGIPLAPLASPGHSATAGTTTALSSTGAAKAEPTEASAVAPPARTYQTLIAIYINQLGTYSWWNQGFTSAVPANVTFSTNITWGAISSADTHVSLNITNDYTGQYRVLTYPTNFSFDPANVVTFNNNGVPTSNYTWTVGLNASNLGCGKSVSCGSILFPDDYYSFEVTVNENGASMGGGLASSSAYMFSGVNLVSTFTWGWFITPAYTATTVQATVPVSIEFALNTSWGYTSNATTDVVFEAIDYDTGATYWVSYNGTLNSNAVGHNGVDVSSKLVFNGTVGGIPYSNATFFVTLNQSFFACKYFSCNTTFGLDNYMGLVPFINESGTSAGGYPGWTGLYTIYPTADYVLTGSTQIYYGQTILTSSPQGLPWVLSGWLDTTWVNPSTAVGNHTITGYVTVWNATSETVLAHLSLNNSVGAVNSAGFLLTTVSNGTVLGIPYTNYTWSLTLSAANLGANLPYGDYYYASVTLTANGTGAGVGGVLQNELLQVKLPYNVFPATYSVVYSMPTYGIPFYDTSFAEYPTTLSLALSSPLPGYVPLTYVQNFTIAVGNAPITPTNTLISVNIIDATITKESQSIFVNIATGLTLYDLVGPDYISVTPMTVADNQTVYSFPVSPLALTCSTPVCTFLASLGLGNAATDIYDFNITASVNGIGLPTNGTYATSFYQTTFYYIFEPLLFYLVSPTPAATITPGNLTVTIFYEGSFISGPPTLNIYSPTGALVLSESFSYSGQNFTWVVTTAGTYHASLVVTTAYLINGHSVQYSNTTLTVNKVPRIYVNSTAYSNATLVPGLSAAGAGTLLLILGLIIGMIVALLLGRAVWGGRQAPTPPQAWETKPAEGAGAGAAAGAGAGTAAAAGANTCSVCGKSFATPEELTAHGKSEHGME